VRRVVRSIIDRNVSVVLAGLFSIIGIFVGNYLANKNAEELLVVTL